jgi:hypothetical protein
VNVASTYVAPSRTSRARAWLIRRPRRRTSTWTWAGPGVGDAMYVAEAEIGCGWAGPSLVAVAATAARAMVANR